MAPTELPQRGQKALLDVSDERQVVGKPDVPVHSTFSAANSIHTTVGAPVCFLHISQEQLCELLGFVASKRIEPHKQPPT